jgi:hypothetical protein
LREAEELLTGQGRRTPEAKELLAPAEALLEDVPFWLDASEGLAAFLAPGFFRFYRVPLLLDDRVVVADHFHVKPILPMVTGEGRFYVLILSHKALRLLEGTPDTIQEIDLRKVPINVAEAYAYGDEPPRREAVATGTRPNWPPAVFETDGIAENTTRDDLLEYFHRVDCGLRELFSDEQTPLVLAGHRRRSGSLPAGQ